MIFSGYKKSVRGFEISKLQDKANFIGRSSESFNQFTGPLGQTKKSFPFFAVKDRRRIKGFDVVTIDNFEA